MCTQLFCIGHYKQQLAKCETDYTIDHEFIAAKDICLWVYIATSSYLCYRTLPVAILLGSNQWRLKKACLTTIAMVIL